jgi:hypothetical protein
MLLYFLYGKKGKIAIKACRVKGGKAAKFFVHTVFCDRMSKELAQYAQL